MKRVLAGKSRGGARATLAAASILTSLAILAVGGPASATRPLTDAAGSQVTRLGMDGVVDVSKDGRIALGRVGTQVVVRDVANGRTLRRLPSSGSYDYGAGSNQLSDNGRYVAYLKVVRQVRNCTEEGDLCRYWAPYVRDRITNKARRVATTSKGRPLSMPSPTGAGIDQLGFRLGGISGNGRYVAFTEAYDTKGVYVKDMKRGTLKRVMAGGWVSHLSISEDGRWIAGMASGETTGIRPFIIHNRTHLRYISEEALYGELTTGGRSMYLFKGRNSAEDPWLGYRYDTTSGSFVDLPPTDPAVYGGSRQQRSMSRHGRYVTWEYSFPAGETSVPRQSEIGVYDRETGVRHDLSSLLTEAGVPGFAVMPPGTSYGSGASPLISGDGKVVFSNTSQGMVAIRWMH